MGQLDSQHDSQWERTACWFAVGVLTGAVAACLCAVFACAGRARPSEQDGGEVQPGRDHIPDRTSDGISERTPDRASAVAQSAPPASTLLSESGPESGADMFEYRGFVVHLFWQALGADRYKAWCDIWEAGAVVQEAGGPPATYPTPAEARMAAGAWARHWVQSNG